MPRGCKVAGVLPIHRIRIAAVGREAIRNRGNLNPLSHRLHQLRLVRLGEVVLPLHRRVPVLAVKPTALLGLLQSRLYRLRQLLRIHTTADGVLAQIVFYSGYNLLMCSTCNRYLNITKFVRLFTIDRLDKSSLDVRIGVRILHESHACGNIKNNLYNSIFGKKVVNISNIVSMGICKGKFCFAIGVINNHASHLGAVCRRSKYHLRTICDSGVQIYSNIHIYHLTLMLLREYPWKSSCRYTSEHS